MIDDEKIFFDGLLTSRELINEVIVEIEELYKNHGRVTGLSTGFAMLDNLTNGMQYGELTVLAGHPNAGRTALAMNIVEHIAIDAGYPVAIFSLELSRRFLIHRLLCSRSNVGSHAIGSGLLAKSDLPNLFRASGEIAKAEIHIDDTPALKLSELRQRSIWLHQKFGVKLIVIDPVHSIQATTPRDWSDRLLEIEQIAQGIQALAKELDIPILGVARLWTPAATEIREPFIPNFRDWRILERYSNTIWVLTRPELYATNESERKAEAGNAELAVVRQRNGPPGLIPLRFDIELTRFTEPSLVEDFIENDPLLSP